MAVNYYRPKPPVSIITDDGHEFPVPKYIRMGMFCSEMQVLTPEVMVPFEEDAKVYGVTIRVMNHNYYGCHWNKEQVCGGHEVVLDRFMDRYGVDLYELALLAGPAPDQEEESTTFWR